MELDLPGSLTARLGPIGYGSTRNFARVVGNSRYKRKAHPRVPMKRRVRFVALLVLASAFVGGCSTLSERERILKQDLWMMR
jgi:hypothetical protein